MTENKATGGIEKKRAILVLGAESSGTRMLTAMLIKAGANGRAGHTQKWDAAFPANQRLIVWRRSVPHAGKWSFIEDMVAGLRIREYRVIACVTTRDWYAIMKSQARRHAGGDERVALTNTQTAYRIIFQALAVLQVPYLIFSYEAAVNRGLDYVNEVLKMLKLNPIDDFQIRQENDKYYQ